MKTTRRTLRRTRKMKQQQPSLLMRYVCLGRNTEYHAEQDYFWTPSYVGFATSIICSSDAMGILARNRVVDSWV